MHIFGLIDCHIENSVQFPMYFKFCVDSIELLFCILYPSHVSTLVFKLQHNGLVDLFTLLVIGNVCVSDIVSLLYIVDII